MKLLLSKIIFLSIGPVCILRGLWKLYLETRPRRWESTRGVITKNVVEREEIGRGRVQYVPIIEYRYHFNGKTITGNADVFTIGSQSSTLKMTAKYPLGSEVEVFVNPKDHRKSAIEHKVTPISMLYIAIGIPFLSYTIITFIHSIHSK
jgi:hypothetical protein